ncbi:MAG: cation transporter [bacterium]
MRKAMGIILIAAICLTFGFIQVQAGEGCASNDKTTSANASSKSCAAGDATAKLTGSNAACDAAKAAYCTPEECAEWSKLCEKYNGKCENRTISIKGMTCAGCENDVKTTLMKVDGVLEVLKVSHTNEVAIVCVDPVKMSDNTSLITPVVNKGYKAEIIPAVATTETSADSKKAACANTCTAAQQKACGASKTDHPDVKKEETQKDH